MDESTNRNRETSKILEAVFRALFSLFRSYFHLIESVFRFVDPNYRLPAILTGQAVQSIDERITKIDSARENLQDAIDAIDELRRQADENKASLQDAMKQIAEIENEKRLVHADLEALRQVAGADTSAFRRVVGIPGRSDIWRERAIGFASGVIASTVASFVFLALQKIL